MFTDIHTHILDKIDDGCGTIEESVFLLKEAAKNGVDNVIVTPHFDLESSNPPTKKEILEKIDFLALKIKESNININIYPGSEVRISPALSERLKDKEFFNTYQATLTGGNKYILIEAPFLKMPPDFEETVFKIKLAGLTPILAHPERNSEIRQDISFLDQPRHEGLLVQINTSSIVEKRGSQSHNTAVKLLKEDMVDFIASDCHYAKGRYSNFESAFKILNKIAGKHKAKQIALHNPELIINNKDFLY